MTETLVSDRLGCGWIALATLANFVVRVFCVLAVIAVFGSATWLFTMFLDNADAELPAVTQTMLDCQRFVTDWWHLSVPLLLFDVLVFLLLVSRSSSWRWLATVYSFLVPLATIGLLTIAFIAFALPFGRLADEGKKPSDAAADHPAAEHPSP